MSWRQNVRGKKLLLDYFSANSSILNELSLPEVFTYLFSAIEIERAGSPWFIMSLKALSDCMFVKAFEAYAMEKGLCLLQAINEMYQQFTSDALPVDYI